MPQRLWPTASQEKRNRLVGASLGKKGITQKIIISKKTQKLINDPRITAELKKKQKFRALARNPRIQGVGAVDLLKELQD